ncbi:MAG TPA: polysaccharide deacetylase family protein [Chitinophagaceae bacterium]|nr:polysaccharide deacetylase family protein [Chitinophagaceae bacterium]
MRSIFKRIIYPTLLSAVFFINHSCNKNDIANVNSRGGIALTFDDHYVDNWHQYMGLFDSMGVRATFYISNYNKFTAAQKIKLREIKEHGHEIAFHSTNHVNFLKYADSSGCNRLIKEEVRDGLRLMNNDGFYPTTFAYPYGKHNDVLDKMLLRTFKSVRALNGTQDFSRSLAFLQGNTLLFGLGIDESSKRNLEKIKGLLFLAQQTNHCAVLLVHNIERNNLKMQIPLSKLKEILSTANSLNLKFYTISEISK